MQDQKNSLLHDADRIPTNDFGGLRSDSSDEILAPPVVEAPLSARHRSGRGGALGPTGMMMPPMMAGGMGMGAGGGAHAASAATSMRVTSAGGVLPPGAGMTGGATASSVTAANAGVSSGGFGAGTGSFSASGMGGWSPSSAPLPASGPAVSTGTHAADGADAGSSTPATRMPRRPPTTLPMPGNPIGRMVISPTIQTVPASGTRPTPRTAGMTRATPPARTTPMTRTTGTTSASRGGTATRGTQAATIRTVTQNPAAVPAAPGRCKPAVSTRMASGSILPNWTRQRPNGIAWPIG